LCRGVSHSKADRSSVRSFLGYRYVKFKAFGGLPPPPTCSLFRHCPKPAKTCLENTTVFLLFPAKVLHGMFLHLIPCEKFSLKGPRQPLPRILFRSYAVTLPPPTHLLSWISSSQERLPQGFRPCFCPTPGLPGVLPVFCLVYIFLSCCIFCAGCFRFLFSLKSGFEEVVFCARPAKAVSPSHALPKINLELVLGQA